MVIKFTFKRHILKVVMILFVVIITTIFAIYILRKLDSNSQINYYSTRISELKSDVAIIDASSNTVEKSSLADQLTVYDKTLKNILKNCNQLREGNAQIKSNQQDKLIIYAPI